MENKTLILDYIFDVNRVRHYVVVCWYAILYRCRYHYYYWLLLSFCRTSVSTQYQLVHELVCQFLHHSLRKHPYELDHFSAKQNEMNEIK